MLRRATPGLAMMLGWALSIACNRDERCLAYAGGSGPKSSSAHFTNCVDSKKRDVQCNKQQDGYRCECIVDGTVSGEFKRIAPFPQQFEQAQQVANSACNWSLSR